MEIDSDLVEAYRAFSEAYGEWIKEAWGNRGAAEHFGVRDRCNKAYWTVIDLEAGHDFPLAEGPVPS